MGAGGHDELTPQMGLGAFTMIPMWGVKEPWPVRVCSPPAAEPGASASFCNALLLRRYPAHSQVSSVYSSQVGAGLLWPHIPTTRFHFYRELQIELRTEREARA